MLIASIRIIDTMSQGTSVLIHCSDGWDRTSQVSSLVQLIVDPYFRTLDGFAVLIEKEWLHAGYNFRTRHAMGESGTDKQGPIFLMFLDGVHQLYVQNLESFEFNMQYLCDMAYHTYSGVYGTFLCNSEQVFSKK
jgi:Myotubularin-like phosphatase domain